MLFDLWTNNYFYDTRVSSYPISGRIEALWTVATATNPNTPIFCATIPVFVPCCVVYVLVLPLSLVFLWLKISQNPNCSDFGVVHSIKYCTRGEQTLFNYDTSKTTDKPEGSDERMTVAKLNNQALDSHIEP